MTIVEEQNSTDSLITEKQIKSGIHSRLDILTNGSIDAYKEIYPKPYLLVKRVLTGAKSYFSYSDLDSMLKEITSLAKENNLTRDDIRTLLTESGVIGIFDKENYLGKSDKSIVQGSFEYQIKGTITLNNSTMCVIHPMFYQDLQVFVDVNKYIIPKPAEDEEIESFKEIGIILA